MIKLCKKTKTKNNSWPWEVNVFGIYMGCTQFRKHPPDQLIKDNIFICLSYKTPSFCSLWWKRNHSETCPCAARAKINNRWLWRLRSHRKSHPSSRSASTAHLFFFWVCVCDCRGFNRWQNKTQDFILSRNDYDNNNMGILIKLCLEL